MKRRIAILTLITASLLGSGSAAQAVLGNTTTAGGYVGCVGVDLSDHSLCIKNPLPPRLPLPQ